MRSLVLILALACARPAELEVRVTPHRTFYRVGERVRLEAMLAGAGPVDARWAIEPATLLARDEGPDLDVFIERGGWTIVTACHGDLCDRVGLFGDDGPPVLELFTPRPGEILGFETGFAVGGRVSGDPARTIVSIDGWGAVPVAADGTFYQRIVHAVGVNHVAVRADDGTRTAVRELDVFFRESSPTEVRLADGGPSVPLDGAFRAYVGVDALARDRVTLPEGAVRLLDVADAIVPYVDALALAPDPVIEGARITSVSSDVLSPPQVSFFGESTTIARGLRLIVELEIEGRPAAGSAELALARTSEWTLATERRQAIAELHGGGTRAELTTSFDAETELWLDVPGRRALLREALAGLGAQVSDVSVRATWRELALGLVPSTQEISLGPGIGATIEVVPAAGRSSYWSAASAAFDALVRPTADAPRLGRSLPLARGSDGSASGTLVEMHARVGLFEALTHLAWAQGAFDVELEGARIAPVLPPALTWSSEGNLTLTLGQLELSTPIDGEARSVAATFAQTLGARSDAMSFGLEPIGAPSIDVWSIDGRPLDAQAEDVVRERIEAALEPAIAALDLRVRYHAPPTGELARLFPGAPVPVLTPRPFEPPRLWSHSVQQWLYWE